MKFKRLKFYIFHTYVNLETSEIYFFEKIIVNIHYSLYNFWILSTLCSHPPLEKSNNWPIKANCFTIQETPIFGAHVRKFGPETTHNHHHLLFEHIYTLANAGWKLYQLITTILEARFFRYFFWLEINFFRRKFQFHNRSTCPFPASTKQFLSPMYATSEWFRNGGSRFDFC